MPKAHGSYTCHSSCQDHIRSSLQFYAKNIYKKKFVSNQVLSYCESSRESTKPTVSQLPSATRLSGHFNQLTCFNSHSPCTPLVLSAPSIQIGEPSYSPTCRKFLILKASFELSKADVTNQPR